jgi:hypothetical protein
MWCDDAQQRHTMPTEVGIHVFAARTSKDAGGRPAPAMTEKTLRGVIRHV